jgi:hypothetical protein
MMFWHFQSRCDNFNFAFWSLSDFRFLHSTITPSQSWLWLLKCILLSRPIDVIPIARSALEFISVVDVTHRV